MIVDGSFVIWSWAVAISGCIVGMWLGAFLQRRHYLNTGHIFFSKKNWEPWEPEPKPEQQDNGLLGRLIVENARLRVRLDAIELPHATHKYVCTHCSHMFNVGRNQEVFICPACGGSSEN